MDKNFLEDPKKLNNIINFINTTKDIINNEGIENVSTRKISNLSKLHNSTIYLYFENLTELTMLACISYLNDYSKALLNFGTGTLTSEESFLGIWDIFMFHALEKPTIFDYFFFQDEDYDLEDFLNTYYAIFSNELKEFPEAIRIMYYGKNIYIRSMKILAPLLDCDGFTINKDNIDLVNELIISYSSKKIRQAMKNNSNKENLKNEFMLMLKHICGIK